MPYKKQNNYGKKNQTSESKLKDNFKKRGYQYVTLNDVVWNITVPKEFFTTEYEKVYDAMEEDYYEKQEMEMEDYQEQLDDGLIADETEFLNDNGDYGFLYQEPFELDDDKKAMIHQNIRDKYEESLSLPKRVVIEFENYGDMKDLDLAVDITKEIYLDKVKEIYNVEPKDFKKATFSTESQILSYNIEKEISNLQNSEEYKKFLQISANFKKYSPKNTALVLRQKPDATLVKGAAEWKNLGRYINAGEMALYTMNATPPRKYDDKAKLEKYLEQSTFYTQDSKDKIMKDFEKDGFVYIRFQPTYKITTQNELDKYLKGNTYLSKRERELLQENFKKDGFTLVSYGAVHPQPVFDISQTNGKEIEVLKMQHIEMDMDNFELIKNTLIDYAKEQAKVSVSFVNEITSKDKKEYSLDTDHTTLQIKGGLSEADTIKTLVEGIADTLLHSKDLRLPGLKKIEKLDYRTEKLESCSVAYSICDKLGINTDYAFQEMWKTFGDMSAGFERTKHFSDVMSRIHVCVQNVSQVLDEKVLSLQKDNQKDEVDKDEIDER